MKISGFTLIRNGIHFDYPYLESLASILFLVDELVINVGIGDDKTLEAIHEFKRNADPTKTIIIFESDWQLDNPEKKQSGLILSEQTNLALEKCSLEWCVYLQADEVIHEKDVPLIRTAIEKAALRADIDGLVFDYYHFYGSYNVIQESRSTYRREVRAIKKSSTARSIGDAQSFRKQNGEKLRVISSGGHIYHYGWVRSPEAMKEKTFFLDQLYHGEPSEEDAISRTPHTGDNYRYKRIWGLKSFQGTHPSTMKTRIQNQGWNWDLKGSPFVFSWRDLKRVLLDSIERFTGYRLFEYRSYRLS
jgi:glycosyltransferase involved in cell wall biosynthesis